MNRRHIAAAVVLVGIALLGLPSPAAAQPVHASASRVVNGGLADLLEVPVDRRLLIEHVSAHVLVQDGNQATMLIRTTLFDQNGAPQIREHYFGLTPQDEWMPGSWRLVTNGVTRLYADPGTTVQVVFNCGPSTCSPTASLSTATIVGVYFNAPGGGSARGDD